MEKNVMYQNRFSPSKRTNFHLLEWWWSVENSSGRNERRTRWIAKIISAKIDESHEVKRIRGSSSEFDKLPNSSLLWNYSNVLGISGEERKKKKRKSFFHGGVILTKISPEQIFQRFIAPIPRSRVNSTPRFVRFFTWLISEKLGLVCEKINKRKKRIEFSGGWELFWSAFISLNETVILIADKKKKIFIRDFYDDLLHLYRTMYT